MRRLACLSLIVLPVALSMAPSCKVGDFSEQGDESAASDAAAVVVFDAGDVVDEPDAMVLANCEEAVVTNLDGHHNPGQTCIGAGCHDGNTANAPLWTLAGTAYTDVNGVAPLVGGTILYTDAAGTEVKLITEQNGNFYTAQTIVFPLQTQASRCPDTLPMNTPVAENMTNCNTAGCHGEVGNRIYVPE